MATVTNGTGNVVSSTQPAASWMWFVKEFLKANTGWTCIGSSGSGVGTGIGNDAVVSEAQFGVQGSWFAMQSPDATVQMLFTRGDGAAYNLYAYLNPAADYAGGGGVSSYPTSATYATNGFNIWTNTQFIQSAAVQRLHITAETGTGVTGWAVYTHLAGNFESGLTLVALMPVVSTDPNEVQPWVFFWGGGNQVTLSYWISEGAGANTGHCWAVKPNTTTVTGCSALTLRAAGDVWPNNAGVNSDSDEMLMPITFARRSALADTHYKGVSSYALWPSVSHTSCDTLIGKTKIMFQDVVFPWDGVSTPSVS